METHFRYEIIRNEIPVHANVKETCYSSFGIQNAFQSAFETEKSSWSLFMDGVQLPQG